MTGGWKRLAVFECWCKYEAPLDDFVHVAPVVSGQSLELQIMVRASGGGTGLYEQTEAWFRPRRGILEPVISFTRRRSQSCPDESCHSYERRWFDGTQLIEDNSPLEVTRSSSTYEADNAQMFRSQLLRWEISDSAIGSFTCTPYKWDAVNFKYTPSGPAHPCKYEPPK